MVIKQTAFFALSLCNMTRTQLRGFNNEHLPTVPQDHVHHNRANFYKLGSNKWRRFGQNPLKTSWVSRRPRLLVRETREILSSNKRPKKKNHHDIATFQNTQLELFGIFNVEQAETPSESSKNQVKISTKLYKGLSAHQGNLFKNLDGANANISH